jgi:hypothetical protein
MDRIGIAKMPTRGSAAEVGVRPTITQMPASAKLCGIGLKPTPLKLAYPYAKFPAERGDRGLVDIVNLPRVIAAMRHACHR